jgi:uncharacterized protein (DUF1330 family)
MKAYVISEVEVLDENAAGDYRRLAAASIADYGGRYLARGARAEVVEGEPTERQVIIVEFTSLVQAREWYASPVYAKALRFRERALDRRLMFVEGVSSTAV